MQNMPTRGGSSSGPSAATVRRSASSTTAMSTPCSASSTSGSNDRALAEDFTSETFLRALRRIGTISYQGRDIGAWFVTIARNIVLDHVKSARHRLEVTTADTVEGRTARAEHRDRRCSTSLTNERLHGGRRRARRRAARVRRCCASSRASRSARPPPVMGKNDGAIKALQHRAVRKLADLVGGELR